MYVVTVISSNSREVVLSPIFVSESEAIADMRDVFNKLCSAFNSNLTLNSERTFFKRDSFRVVAYDNTWYEGRIAELDSPIAAPVTCPQTVIFDGKTSEEVQEKANAFFLRNPNVEIIDTELSANLETTSVEHYFRITYAIIYKNKEEN